MNQRKDAQTRLWIRNRDSLGQMVDRGLIEAAHRVWERARLVVIRYLAEDTEAPEILEAAVDSASRAMGGSIAKFAIQTYRSRCVLRESHILLVFERSKVSSVRSQIELRNGISAGVRVVTRSEHNPGLSEAVYRQLVDQPVAFIGHLIDPAQVVKLRKRLPKNT
jgi:hypothetical protein